MTLNGAHSCGHKAQWSDLLRYFFCWNTIYPPHNVCFITWLQDAMTKITRANGKMIWSSAIISAICLLYICLVTVVTF